MNESITYQQHRLLADCFKSILARIKYVNSFFKKVKALDPTLGQLFPPEGYFSIPSSWGIQRTAVSTFADDIMFNHYSDEKLTSLVAKVQNVMAPDTPVLWSWNNIAC